MEVDWPSPNRYYKFTHVVPNIAIVPEKSLEFNLLLLNLVMFDHCFYFQQYAIRLATEHEDIAGNLENAGTIFLSYYSASWSSS